MLGTVIVSTTTALLLNPRCPLNPRLSSHPSPFRLSGRCHGLLHSRLSVDPSSTPSVQPRRAPASSPSSQPTFRPSSSPLSQPTGENHSSSRPTGSPWGTFGAPLDCPLPSVHQLASLVLIELSVESTGVDLSGRSYPGLYQLSNCLVDRSSPSFCRRNLRALNRSIAHPVSPLHLN